MNKYEKLEQAIKETSNPQITIAQTLLGEDQDCYIKTKVTGLNINGDKATYIHMNDDFEGADLSEVAGFEVDIPQIKELKLSDAVDWFFFDEILRNNDHRPCIYRKNGYYLDFSSFHQVCLLFPLCQYSIINGIIVNS